MDDVAAKVNAKGQVTIPKPMRDALGIETGGEIVFRIEQHRALLARTPYLLDVTIGGVARSAPRRRIPWDSARHSTLRTVARKGPPVRGAARAVPTPDTGVTSFIIDLAEKSATRRSD